MKKYTTPRHVWLATLLSLFCLSVSYAQVVQRGTASSSTSTATVLTITKPDGVVQGDLMIANIASTGSASAASLAGWTVIKSTSLSSSPRKYATVLYRVAGVNEVSSYSFSTGSGTLGASGAIVAFAGVDPVSPFDVSATSIQQTTSTSVSASGRTTVTRNAAVIFLGQAVGAAGGSTISWTNGAWTTANAPGALTELFDREESTNHVSVAAAWGTRSSIGSTGSGKATLSTSVRNGGLLVVLRALDVFPPAVSSTSPVSGATGVSIGSAITATMNESLDLTTVTAANAILQAGSVVIPAGVAFSSSNRRITITPAVPLAARMSYTVTLKGGISGLKDPAGNALAADYVWSFSTVKPSDATAPVVTSTFPLPNATDVVTNPSILATVSEALHTGTVNSTTVYLQKDLIKIPAVVTYTAGTKSLTLTPAAVLEPGTAYRVTLQGGVAGIKDAVGNPLAADYVWSFTTGESVSPACPCTVFNAAQQAQAASAVLENDASGGIELGMKFRSTVNGYITGVRFYKAASNTGTHWGQLWSAAGVLLAQTAFVNESSSGWQQADFSAPVAINAGVTYIVSYHTTAGAYSATANYFGSSVVNAPLRGLANGEDGNNGVFRNTSVPAFPNNSVQSSNYWVDAVFAEAAPADQAAPSVNRTDPADQATEIATGTSITAHFSEPLSTTTVNGTNFVLKQGSTVISATVAYTAGSLQALLIPSSALLDGTQYTVTLKGGTNGISDLAGNVLSANKSWSFTTAVRIPPPGGANNIAAENALPGNPSAEWDVLGAGDPTIQGFATAMSVNRGSTVRFKVNVTGSNTTFGIRIYRLGYYGGSGARLMANLGNFTGITQPSPDVNTIIGLVDCGNWSESASWAVPSDAVSGVYIAKLTRQNTGGSSHIVFVVRNDASTAPIMFKTSDATWQAYNSYGGYSFYTGSTNRPSGRADKISYNRPFDTRSTSEADFLFNAEYPMIRWLERNGYEMSYVTDVDMERNTEPITPSKHTVLLSVGHDEYWSLNMRNNYETARNNGVHLAFFSGNEVYWKTRWENNYRTLVCYKEGSYGQGENNCGDNCDPLPGVWTGLWRHGCEFSEDGCKPENALTGQISWTESELAIKVPYAYRNLPFWRNTRVASLQAGQEITLTEYTLGYEWNYEMSAYSSYYPSGRIAMSSTTQNGLTHRLSLYTHSSGALVFGAGTIQWSWGLDEVHDRQKPAISLDMQQATVNLLYDMGVQPVTPHEGIVLSSASGDGIPPLSSISSPAQGATVTVNQAITITGSASDAGGINKVELSFDGGLNWQLANGKEQWTYSWTPTVSGNQTILSRATDNAGNREPVGNPPASNAVSVTVSGTVVTNPCPCTVFNTSQAIQPTSANTENDGTALNIGMKFIPSQNGFITALRFYKSSSNTGTHTGQLYLGSGTRLASVVYTSETTSGWQQVNLASPVAVTAGTTYVVSYHSSSGYYSLTQNYFNNSVVSGPLTAPSSGSSGGNGVYVYGSSPARPTSSWNASNYWVDVVFNTTTQTTRAQPGPDAMPKDEPSLQHARGSLHETFALFQNAPNPSTGETVIRYSIPTTSRVVIVLYDMQGRIVRELEHVQRTPGNYQLRLDTRRLAKGMYFYKMYADGFMQSRRLLVE